MWDSVSLTILVQPYSALVAVAALFVIGAVNAVPMLSGGGLLKKLYISLRKSQALHANTIYQAFILLET